MGVGERYHLGGLVIEPGANCLTQAEAAVEMRARLTGLAGAKTPLQLLDLVYTQSAIERRYFEIAPDAAASRSDWYRAQNEATYALSARALDRLFQGSAAAACDGLVIATSSYAGFPALSRRLQARFGLSPEALCFDTTGLGCAGATHALALAHGLLQQGSCRNVAVLAVDIMGSFSHLRRHVRAPSMSQLVAHCLASDAAAALLLSTAPGEQTALSYGGCQLSSRLWSDALDQNDYTADEDNQPFLLVGPAIRHRVGEELEKLLDEGALKGPVIMHPGGAAVMRRLQQRHPEMAPSIDLALSVMSAHGNVGAPSALWVLARALETGMDLTPMFNLVALGPGIVSTCLRFDEVACASEAA
jgi:predicted naringenin-chalcone synthase